MAVSEGAMSTLIFLLVKLLLFYSFPTEQVKCADQHEL